MFPEGTLVMTIAANIGDVAVLDFAACFPDSIVGFVPRYGIERDYLFLVLSAIKPALVRDAPVNIQGSLNIERIGSSSPIPIPPKEEQNAIIKHLDRETAKIDQLVDKVREAIDRLNELRTALVSAAITGKIDIRERAT
jgi:type I restriction enzyme S subunit